MAPNWTQFGSTWAPVGPSLGPSWGALGSKSGHFGHFFGRFPAGCHFCAILDPLGRIWGAFLEHLGRFGGSFWSFFGLVAGSLHKSWQTHLPGTSLALPSAFAFNLPRAPGGTWRQPFRIMINMTWSLILPPVYFALPFQYFPCTYPSSTYLSEHSLF